MSTFFDREFSIGHYLVYSFKTGRWKQNSYVIHDTQNQKVIVVDPGGEAEKIIGFIETLRAPVTCVCLTHAHHDHVGALKAVCERFNQTFYIHQNDLKLLRRAPFFSYSFEARKMDVPTTGQVFLPADKTGKVYERLEFIHTPGHTTGGVVIHIDKLAFTGDTLLNKMVGRTDLPGASVHELASSITYFLSELDEDVTLFPGHGEPWTVKEAKAWWEVNKENTPEYRTEDHERGY